ncbi:PstS family phosphate ABC transporter substrate-binding protein [bacterium]|nr:PstS family phosphate ABC transporter substrate-binding protein [bacterium]
MRYWAGYRKYVVLFACVALIALAGCGKPPASDQGQAAAAPDADPSFADRVIAVDGSSTVFPITEAVAEEYQKVTKARVTVGISGTGGGFKKFCSGETVIADASRPIKSAEVEACAAKGVEYVELPVAYDGLAVVVHPENDWIASMTVADLKKIWEPEAQGKIMKWSDVRKEWPNEELHLFGAGVDSGTYDYFTEAIVGKEHASRGDFTASEDDNVLVQGVSTDKFALGFFGFAYYAENAAKLKLVPIDDGNPENGNEPVAPSMETVGNGTYQPLSRPIFIYASKEAANTRPEVDAFVRYYLEHGGPLTREVGYIPLPDQGYRLALKRFADRTTGSMFSGGSKVGVTVEQLLAGEEAGGGEAKTAEAGGEAAPPVDAPGETAKPE